MNSSFFKRYIHMRACWKSKENQDRISSDVTHMHVIDALDNIIHTKQHLQNATRCDIKD